MGANNWSIFYHSFAKIVSPKKSHVSRTAAAASFSTTRNKKAHRHEDSVWFQCCVFAATYLSFDHLTLRANCLTLSEHCADTAMPQYLNTEQKSAALCQLPNFKAVTQALKLPFAQRYSNISLY